MAARPTFTSPSHDRFRQHTPTKSSPLRHTVSTRSNASETDSSVQLSRNGTLSSNATSAYSQSSRSDYSSYDDPFTTRTASKRERSESPVKKNAMFAKWEEREQASQEQKQNSIGRASGRPTLAPTKLQNDDSRGISSNRDFPQESRMALKPVNQNATPERVPAIDEARYRDCDFKENIEHHSTFESMKPHVTQLSASKKLFEEPVSTASAADPSKMTSPSSLTTKNSLATLSRSDSMRAASRSSRGRGHVRFQSVDQGTVHLDEQDLGQLQKSSTPHLRHLSKLASETGGTQDLEVHSAEEQVTGLAGRRKLQRSTEAQSNSKSQSRFSSHYSSTKWMDTQRKHLQAYEYLCHIGEARAWLEDVLEPDKLPPIVQLEEALRDGVTLAEAVVRLAPRLTASQQRALGSQKIFRSTRLQFRHSDNIALFFRFLAEIELPELFRFELVDLYEKKNIPKVIYCIHALSWMLFRKGIVDFRIGNLVGQLQFEDHELEETQKGIDRSGVQMPNFGGMREAMQVEEEPPAPEPTPEELLAEEEDVIVELQTQMRGALLRMQLGDVMQDLWNSEDELIGLQALARGGFARQIFGFRKDMHQSTQQFQATAKGFLIRRSQNQRSRIWSANAAAIVNIQSLWRGRQQRKNTQCIKTQLRTEQHGIKEIQAAIRGALGRWRAGDLWQETRDAHTELEVTKLQAAARGLLQRFQQKARHGESKLHESSVAQVQASMRGILERARLARMQGALQGREAGIVKLQSMVRSQNVKLAQKQVRSELSSRQGSLSSLQAQIRGRATRQRTSATRVQLQSTEKEALALQALSRAMLQRKMIGNQLAALENDEDQIVLLQALARAFVERQRIYEDLVEFDKEDDNIIKLQALARAMLIRSSIGAMLSELEDHEPVLAELQAALRGFTIRRQFAEKRRHYLENMQKVIKLQSHVRAKQQGESYKSLVSGKNPPLPVVRRHLHLLTDSNLEFEGELEADRLRRQVIESVRRNEHVEGYVEGLDVKIALLVKNKITLDEVVKHQKHFGGSASQLLRTGSTLQNGSGLNLKALNKNTRKKLSAYEELFFLVQTQPQYLARLFMQLTSRGLPEKEGKNIERLILTLFSHGQKGREEYLLLKVLALGSQQTISQCQTIEDLMRQQSGTFHQRLLLSYIRSPRDRSYLKSLLGGLVKNGICAQDHLDLESDPLQIYMAILNNEELSTGRPSQRPRNLPREVVIRQEDVRPKYVQHLQELRDLGDAFFASLEETLHRMPYGVRHLATEQYRALCEHFPRDDPAHMAMLVGSWLWKTYIAPALREPEMWGVIDRGLSPIHKRNLSQVIVILSQVAGAGRLFGPENLYLQPLNNWVTEALERWHACLQQCFDIPSPEEHYDADQYSDLYSKTKPVLYIKLADIFALHSLLADNISAVAPYRDDPMKELLMDLGTPKSNETDLGGASNGNEITLTLKSRFTVQEDPNAEARALFTATKRLVLYIIRVQSGSNLMEILLRPISHEDEDRWVTLIEEEMAEKERESRNQRRPRSAVPDPRHSVRGGRAQSVYSEAPSTFSEDRRDLMDIQGMTYAELKSTALENILSLEQTSIAPQYRVSRQSNYQELLNALASDIRQKHRRRLERQRETEATRATLAQLDAKAAFLEDQLKSYNDYIEQCLQTLASKKNSGGNKKFLLPFTKQWSHERELERAGRKPQFGSYKYSVKGLAEKGVLLSWPRFPHDQWGNVDIVISSDEVGVFHLEASTGSLMVPGASADLLLDDLLQAQYDNRNAIAVFDESAGSGQGASLAVNLLLHLVFKKFYRDE